MFLSFFPDYSSEPVSETKDPARLDKEYDTAATNYLEMLADSASTAPTEGKSSYSPFGSNKPKGSVSNSNILYQPPVDTSSFFDDVTPQQPSLLSNDMLPSEEERDNTPVSSYLERLVIPLGDASTIVKKSFSPFGDGGKTLKGQESASDSLYKPPAESLSVTSDVLPSDEERDSIPVANYLERIVIPLDDTSAGGKKSFSPFGDGGKILKGQTSDSNTLYKPPAKLSASDELPSDEERDRTPVSNYLERLVISLDDAFTSSKKSFSPFGDGGKIWKGQASDSNFLYGPPAESSAVPYELPSDEERDNTPVSNYLEKLVIPLSGASNFLKKSFSPFGDGGKTLKGQRSGSDILYKPPVEVPVVSTDSPLKPDELPSAEERDSTPVSNYLERTVIPLGDPPDGKRSFSPFGDGGKALKGHASGSDSLYEPPVELPVVSNELPSDEERDSTPVSNYLEKLVIPLSGASTFLKKSFSPFGRGGKTPKDQRSGTDILYNPPVESPMVSDEREADMSDLDDSASPTTIMGTSAEPSLPLMDGPESPNPFTGDSDIMREYRYVEQEEYEVEVMNQNDSYQEENGGSTYLTSLSDFEKPPKSSYSPFGFSGTEKFESSISDLYTTAETQNLDHSGLENNGFTTEPTDHGLSIDEGRENYLESLGGSVPYGKKSFSPFGSYSESKLSDGSTDTLYDSP